MIVVLMDVSSEPSYTSAPVFFIFHAMPIVFFGTDFVSLVMYSILSSRSCLLSITVLIFR